jgi:hypothetical protein
LTNNDIQRKKQEIKNQVDTHLITMAASFAAFSCSALRKSSVFTLQKHCFLHANSMLLGHNINAITTLCY